MRFPGCTPVTFSRGSPLCGVDDRMEPDRLPRSAYVHVPFCRHRCGYCDFTLVAGRDDLADAYLDALRIELETLEESPVLDTLFVGGGTPTHLTADRLGRLFELLDEHLRLNRDAEISVEANPSDFADATRGPAKLSALASAGVNRISLGAQSFDAGILRILERDHKPSDIRRAVDVVRSRIENVSLDLIFGVPGQTLPGWRETLAEALSLTPAHVSTYGLTFEKGTAFWSRRNKGEMGLVPEESERLMYAAAMDTLGDAGFEQYELSNFARLGRRCRHNEVYWDGRPFYGFGPGAARFIDGKRVTNHRSVTTWIKRTRAGLPATGGEEQLSPEASARELLVVGLRRTAGVDKREFQRRTGFTIKQLTGGELDRHLEGGLLDESDSHLRLTRAGRFLADTVIVDCL